VLVVDDSAVVRRMIRSCLEADPEFSVVAEAANGREAIDRLHQAQPDAVICDVEMPVMSGIETVEELRLHWPRLPVVMFASPTREAAQITLEALHAGANDFVAKPSAVGGSDLAAVLEQLRGELGGKLKALVRGRGDISAVARAVLRYAPRPPAETPTPAAGTPTPTLGTPAVATPPLATRPRPAPRPDQPAVPRPARRGRCDAVLIAVSTGGPNALGEVIPRLPADLAVPVLVVQHMPPVFTRLLAERLAARAALPVTEAVQGEEVRPGRVLIAAGDHHLAVGRDGPLVRSLLNRDPPENSVRPAADVLLRSAAAVWGGNVLVVVMTGMGQDGLLGTMQLHHLGAQVLVQDEASSVVWGMPGAVARAGVADEQVPLARLAEAIAARTRGR